MKRRPGEILEGHNIISLFLSLHPVQRSYRFICCQIELILCVTFTIGRARFDINVTGGRTRMIRTFRKLHLQLIVIIFLDTRCSFTFPILCQQPLFLYLPYSLPTAAVPLPSLFSVNSRCSFTFPILCQQPLFLYLPYSLSTAAVPLPSLFSVNSHCSFTFPILCQQPLFLYLPYSLPTAAVPLPSLFSVNSRCSFTFPILCQQPLFLYLPYSLSTSAVPLPSLFSVNSRWSFTFPILCQQPLFFLPSLFSANSRCSFTFPILCQQPLFLYLPHQAVHSANPSDPLEAPWKYLEKFGHIKHKGRRTFAGQLNYKSWYYVLCNSDTWLSKQVIIMPCYHISYNSALAFQTHQGKGTFLYGVITCTLDRSQRFTPIPLADLLILTPTQLLRKRYTALQLLHETDSLTYFLLYL